MELCISKLNFLVMEGGCCLAWLCSTLHYRTHIAPSTVPGCSAAAQSVSGRARHSFTRAEFSGGSWFCSVRTILFTLFSFKNIYI